MGEFVGVDVVSLSASILILTTPFLSSAAHLQLEDLSTHDVCSASYSDNRELTSQLSQLEGSSSLTDDIPYLRGFVFTNISC